MPTLATLAQMLEPLRADPPHSAVLLDVDGTLAPIVRRAGDARIDAATRTLVAELAGCYGMVACISGRPAAVARQIVGIETIAYVGNHGCERLAPGASEAVLDAEVAPWIERIRAFAADQDRASDGALARLGVRSEDKGPIAGFHWRGAEDEAAAHAVVQAVEARALADGLAVHWGRKVLEVRPPLQIDKGRGVSGLLRSPTGPCVVRGLYMGDDETDVDAFRGLREALDERAVCVGVASAETPDRLVRAADLMVDGLPGVREVLAGLVR